MSPEELNPNLFLDLPEKLQKEGFVFVSYKREEVEYAKKIHAVLKKNGFAIWWDERLQCGQAWSQVLDEAVRSASCIVVLWSPMAIESKWILHESSVAMAMNNYAPARVEMCTIPPPFNQLQATDIMDWDGVSEHPGINDLINRCNQLMPKIKSRWERWQVLLWAYRVAIIASLFGLISLGILIWQTDASIKQLRASDSQLESLNAFKEQSKKDVQVQIDTLESIINAQRLASEKFKDLQEKSDSSLKGLKKLGVQQLNATENLENLRQQAELNQIRNYFKLEPVTFYYTLEYPLAQFPEYVKNLKKFRMIPDIMNNKTNETYQIIFNEGALPDKQFDEKESARYSLWDDVTEFFFIEKAQGTGKTTNSDALKTIGLNGIGFNSRREIDRPEITLYVKNNRFVKKVKCKNPKRFGDIRDASTIDLVGREMRYINYRGGVLTEFYFEFSPTNLQENIFARKIYFENGTRSAIISKQHLYLEQIDVIAENSSEFIKFNQISSYEKANLINKEISNRLNLFRRRLNDFESQSEELYFPTYPNRYSNDLSKTINGRYYLEEMTKADKFFNGKSIYWLFEELSHHSKGAAKEKINKALIKIKDIFMILESLILESRRDIIKKEFSELQLSLHHKDLASWEPFRSR